MNNAELQQRKQAVFARGEGNATAFMSRKKMPELWDVEGKRYIDFGVVSPW